MNFFLLIFCFGSLLFPIKGDEAKPAPAPTEKQAPLPAKAAEKPKNTSPPICSKCGCDNVTRTLDCSNKNLGTWLTDDEWNQVNISAFEILLFDHNKFVEVKVFPNITIKKLVLCHNQIAKIEKGAFKNLQALQILDLSNNNLTSAILIPEVFEGRYSPDSYEPIPKLKELNLGYNQLHSLNPDLFEHFPVLETLILNDNVFKTIDRVTETAISNILQLKTLDLSYLELKILPETIFHAPRSLENLQLKGNLLKKIPIALLHAVNLKVLNMDENPFQDFVGDNVFPEMKTLEKLSLSHLPELKKIGNGTFSGLSGLKELIMERNLHLAEIHPAAFSRVGDVGVNVTGLNYPLIEKLNLNHNNLTTLQHVLLTRWDKITLDIRENPWDCQCQNEWLIHDLYKIIRGDNLEYARELGCRSPAVLNGTKFERIYEDKNILRCPDKYGNHPEADGKLLIGILIGLLVGIPIAMAILLLYRRGCLGILSPYRNENSRAFYKRAEFNEDYQI